MTQEDELRPEYRREDFGELVRGKYAARAREASNVIVLQKEVAQAFPNDEAVNAALLTLMRVLRSAEKPRRSSSRPRREP